LKLDICGNFKTNIMKFIFVLSASVIVLLGCKHDSKNQNNELAGNISSNTIVIKGSDTEMEMVKDLASQFKVENPYVKIDISGDGSSIGIEALINNETDIANSSRMMNESEILRAKRNGVVPTQIMFAVDAIAIITNSKLGIDSLSTDQLTKIFSGEITNWKELGGPDFSIVLYGRDSLSGTSYYLKDKFFRTPYSKSINQMHGNSEIVDAVQKDIAGIGFVGVGFLMNENGKPNGSIWAMPIYIEGSPAYSPYQYSAVKKGDYVLTRPLYQYINGAPRKQIYEFIISELTLVGQEIIKKHGFFPINDCQKEINILNGL
jgi:phosphate transport system substrate-binding protein